MTTVRNMHDNETTTHATVAEPAINCGGAADAHVRLAGLICRGTQRMLRDLDYASITECSLGNGRRADILAIGSNGSVIIVEVKSSVADFRADHKWPDYRAYCDRFYFAVSADFPEAILPADAGLILADGYGGAIIREPDAHPIAAARRKAITLAVARGAASRLHAVTDPARDTALSGRSF